jgi:hypothetical protein
MRLLLEIILAAALIALVWNKSVKEWIGDGAVIGQHASALSPTPPRQKAVAPPGISTTPPKSFTGHIYYTDEKGKTYWLDAQGKRHYEP